jgi:hypothetical protein
VTAASLGGFARRLVGSTIVVCGCGPSLRELCHREDLVTIGVNDVGRLFDPTYLVVVNPRQQFKDDRFRFVEHSNARALFTQLDLGRVKPPVVRFRLGRYGGVDPEGDSLHYTQNSPYVGVCLAAHLGATRIGLIGVDFTDDHFFARTGRHPLAGRLREIDAQYARLAAALARRGVELVNLSSISRLTSLPRLRADASGAWLPAAAPTTGPAAAPQLPRNQPMKVSIDKYGPGMVADLLDRLALTCRELGHDVVRQPKRTGHDRNALAIVWNGRNHTSRGPTLYCEHGWLPRSAYQISPKGINADSHLAPFTWDGAPLSSERSAALDAHVEAIKTASYSGYYQYMQASKDDVAPPSEFLLVPFQLENDTNLVRHAPTWLRTMQSLIDYVSRSDPPWPVIFKQHPMDSRHRDSHLRLRTRRKIDSIWPHSRGNIHQLLKSGACRGILTINSNVAHDGLLWDVPAIVLGRNVWPSSGAARPFLTTLPQDWSALASSVTNPVSVACRRAYAHYLIRNQWTLQDAAQSARVAALLADVLASRAGATPALPRPRPKLLAGVPSAPTRRIVATASRPLINVVAANKGWLFETWKQRLADVQRSDLRIAATDRPVGYADAWIFIRAREAAQSPDPQRTVVQLHDLAGAAVYAKGGDRAAVRECAALSLTHPRQREILVASGVDLDTRRVIERPVGWYAAAAPDLPPRYGGLARIAWLGRPCAVRGSPDEKAGDASQLPVFLAAAPLMRSRPSISLIGERLERAVAQLRAAGVDARVGHARQFPLARCGEWLGQFDCVVVTGETDAGPWPLFDALRSGVPVVATRVGAAPALLADGECGRLVDDPADLAAAVDDILAAPQAWRPRRESIARRVADLSLNAWVESNIDLAFDLARASLRRVA